MDVFAILMFLLVGLGASHIAHKVSEGGMSWTVALAIGMPAALAGGLLASGVGMKFYGVLGHMVIGALFASLCFLVWRQIRA